MTETEWQEMVKRVNDDVRGIVRAQRVLEEVNEELVERRGDPFEEDRIFGDGYGFEPGQPRTIVVDGVHILIRTLHRKGLQQRDIKGADLIYEIAGRKFALIQYKDADARNRVLRDHDQLDELVAACPNRCPPPHLGYWPTCGSWFNVKGESELAYLPACHASAVFGDAKSRSFDQFRHGIGPSTFQELFARCWIGARIAPTELVFVAVSAVEADRVVFMASQFGTFGRWPAV